MCWSERFQSWYFQEGLHHEDKHVQIKSNGGANHTATVEALVNAGADVNIPDRHGTTALGHARSRGYSQIARILERAGAH